MRLLKNRKDAKSGARLGEAKGDRARLEEFKKMLQGLEAVDLPLLDRRIIELRGLVPRREIKVMEEAREAHDKYANAVWDWARTMIQALPAEDRAAEMNEIARLLERAGYSKSNGHKK